MKAASLVVFAWAVPIWAATPATFHKDVEPILQKRCQELVRGAQKLVEHDAKSPIDIALEEIVQGKIWLGDRPGGKPASEPVAAGAGSVA